MKEFVQPDKNVAEVFIKSYRKPTSQEMRGRGVLIYDLLTDNCLQFGLRLHSGHCLVLDFTYVLDLDFTYHHKIN